MGNDTFKTIQEAGLSTLLEIYKKYSGVKRDEVLSGIGDDAAVLSVKNKDKVSLTGSEMFLEGVHFDLTYTPLNHLGYKVITASVSDMYAMNAEPLSVSVDMAVPNKISVDMIEQIYQGIGVACKDYGVQVTGGDTTASHQALILSVHVTGLADKGKIVYRKGADMNDAICVTGDLGGAMAGLRILLREKQAWKENPEQRFQPDLEEYEYVVQRQLMPRARKDLIDAFSKSAIKPGSMLDLSQGLMNELQILCQVNHFGCEIYSPAIPIALQTRAVADEIQEDVDRYAFYGGEDYEMLFTMKEHEVEKLKAEFEDFTVIGKIQPEEKGILIQTGEGKSRQIKLNDDN